MFSYDSKSPQKQASKESKEQQNSKSQQLIRPSQLGSNGSLYQFQLQQHSPMMANKTGLPDNLKAGVENLSGLSMDNVRVHYNSDKPARVGALAYTQGTDIHVASGQERHLPHEAWHVVQQAQGRVRSTLQLKGVFVNDDVSLEKEADFMGGKILNKKLSSSSRTLSRGCLSHEPNIGCIAQMKLTKRSEIARNAAGNFDWASHKTDVTLDINTKKYIAEGLGANLSTDIPISNAVDTKYNQLERLVNVITPSYVDDSRPTLPDDPKSYTGAVGIFVVPSAMLGQPISDNLLYLPVEARKELREIQNDMIKAAKEVPGELKVKTTFGADGLPDQVELEYNSLDRVTKNSTYRIHWSFNTDKDRSKWEIPLLPSLAPKPKNRTDSGKKPDTAEWKSHIEWEPVHLSGDGWQVTADKLGPDHKLGSAPNCLTAAKRVETMENASKPLGSNGKAEPYIAGHLLNDHLGGPGTLKENLAPIPKTANSQMSANIETPAKRIVNEERGWIRYKVTVRHEKDPADPTLEYPATINAELGVYDDNGVLTNTNNSSITISPPSSYASKKATKPSATGKIQGNAIAKSPKMIDEVILSQENDLRPFMRDSEDLFRLIFNSELSTSVEQPEISEAWSKVLNQLEEYHKAALPKINLLSTITDALEVWDKDPLAQQYLMLINVKQLDEIFKELLKGAENFIEKAKPFLQKAAIAVNKKISPANLFVDSLKITFAQGLIKEQPAEHSLLQVLRSQQAAMAAARVQKRAKVRKIGDLKTEQYETEMLDKFSTQPDETMIYPSSPLCVSEESGHSVKNIITTALHGAAFESGRMMEVIQKLDIMINSPDSIAKLGQLLMNPVFSKNRILNSVLTTLQEDAKSPKAEIIKTHMVLCETSLQVLAQNSPDVAIAFYQALL